MKFEIIGYLRKEIFKKTGKSIGGFINGKEKYDRILIKWKEDED